MAKMEDKIDRILEEITEMKITATKQEANLLRNTENLEAHMARTAQNEEMIEAIKADIEPIKKHVVFVKGAIWMLGFVGAVLAGLYKSGIIHKLL